MPTVPNTLATAEEVARARFGDDTLDHELTVLQDDGVYRHLRFAAPGSSIYSYNLVTWPGYLAIVGDAGDYVFRRLTDMFQFFEQPTVTINPGYWAEKLVAPRSAERFSEEAFRARVQEWLTDTCEDLNARAAADLTAEVRLQVIDGVYDEHEAHSRVQSFAYQGRRIDAWEWNLNEFDPRFLWCCWAIARGIERYRADQAPVRRLSGRTALREAEMLRFGPDA